MEKSELYNYQKCSFCGDFLSLSEEVSGICGLCERLHSEKKDPKDGRWLCPYCNEWSDIMHDCKAEN